MSIGGPQSVESSACEVPGAIREGWGADVAWVQDRRARRREAPAFVRIIWLLAHAMRLVDEIERHGTSEPIWTFGGGTALMLRYEHRYSKDIDIFVPDPQYLGFVTPGLSEVA
jgi:Nucleotidyl transferase AbiEii toxin, Type IV TA system